MSANNTYRYFSTILLGAPKNFFTRLNTCMSSPARPKLVPFFEKLYRTRTASMMRLPTPPEPVPALTICHSPACHHVARGATPVDCTPLLSNRICKKFIQHCLYEKSSIYITISYAVYKAIIINDAKVFGKMFDVFLT